MRTASEPRGPPSRQYPNARDRDGGRPRLYGETTRSRRQMSEGGFAPVNEDGYADDVYDMYTSPRSNGRGARNQPRYTDEEDYMSDVFEDDPIGDGEFEMMAAPASRTRSTGPRGTSRSRPMIRKFRVKVHAQDDTRYIMVGASIDFGDFEGRIREKFGFRARLRIRMRDEGDMITMADQDDLDMLLSVARDAAKKEQLDMGKMEVGNSLYPLGMKDKKLTHLLQIWVEEK
jgi:hypothetical protein